MLVRAERDAFRAQESEELIFKENPNRWVLLPIEYPTLFKFYKLLQSQYWTPGSIVWTAGSSERVPACVQTTLWALKLRKGFAAHPTIDAGLFPDVLDTVSEVTEYVQSPEGRAFLGFANMMHDFHRETCVAAIETATALNKINSGPEEPTWEQIEALCTPKAVWLKSHLTGFVDESKARRCAGDADNFKGTQGAGDPASMAEVLVTMAITDSIMSADVLLGSLMAQYMDDVRPGGQEMTSNAKNLQVFFERAARDLTLFSDFYAHIYTNLTHKLPQSVVHMMMVEAALLEYNYLLQVFGSDTEMVERFVKANGSGDVPIKSLELEFTGLLGAFVRSICLRTVRALGESEDAFLRTIEQYQMQALAAFGSSMLPLQVSEHRLKLELPAAPDMGNEPYHLDSTEPTTASNSNNLTMDEDF